MPSERNTAPTARRIRMMARGARVATIFGKTTGETSYFLPLQQQECEDDEDDAGAGAAALLAVAASLAE